MTVFESAAIEELVAATTCELAPLLNAARRQMRFHTVALVLAFSLLTIAAINHSTPAVVVAAIVFGLVTWPAAVLFDRHRLTITLEYNLQDSEVQKFGGLVQAFQELAKCQRVWRVP